MKASAKALSVLTIALICLSCATGPPAPPKWDYEEGAIKLKIRADPQLNAYAGVAHTLHLCVYQLRSPNAFNQLADTRNGLYQLLECESFDHSVANAKQAVLHPGDEWNRVLDRAEGTKYVAIAAGYYRLEKEKILRLVEIPVVEDTALSPSQSPVLKPGMLDIAVWLGPTEILQLERTREP